MAPGVTPPWAGLSPILGGLGASLQGEAGGLVPEARLRCVPQGRSSPAEAAHRPDSAARVPGRIEVGGWGGKSRSRAWVWAVRPLARMCHVLPRVAEPRAHAQRSPRRVPAHCCPHAQAMLGPTCKQGHPEGVVGPGLGGGELREMGIQTPQQPLSPLTPSQVLGPGVGKASSGPP